MNYSEIEEFNYSGIFLVSVPKLNDLIKAAKLVGRAERQLFIVENNPVSFNTTLLITSARRNLEEAKDHLGFLINEIEEEGTQADSHEWGEEL
ncbi:hypothetical protein [Lactobacillus acetotolerans]|uniref:hypothetical protein n=1 Tax=Lactobacillus acetotolerans TaxID=1600 RepID=UPI002FD9E7DE